MDKKAIILIGPPGSGKGTQAELLAEKLGFFHWESSLIVKHWMKLHTDHPLLKKSMQSYAQGGLFEPELMAHVVQEESEKYLQRFKGIIYDGSPRTLPETYEIWPFWKKFFGRKNILVLNLKIDPKIAEQRLTSRLICEFDHPYINGRDGLTVGSACPKDGSRLKTRDIDNPEVVKVRFEEFKKQTLPVIELLRHDVEVIDINAEQSVTEVFDELVKKLTPHLDILKRVKTKETRRN